MGSHIHTDEEAGGYFHDIPWWDRLCHHHDNLLGASPSFASPQATGEAVRDILGVPAAHRSRPSRATDFRKT